VDVYAISSTNYKYDLGINQLIVSSISASFTGSLLGTGSYALQALSASYAPGSSAFPYTGNALISGSLAVSGGLVLPVPAINDLNVSPNYGYMNIFSRGGIHLKDTGVFNTKLIIDNVFGSQTQLGCETFLIQSSEGTYLSAWPASTVSGLTENTLYSGGTSNFKVQSEGQMILSSSLSRLILSSSVATVTGSFNVKGNTIISGSTTIDSILTLVPRTTTPTGIASGSIIVSGSATGIKPYFWNGSTWTAMF
jgi:hypothetical protein